MKTYVINLDRSKDRMAFMHKQLSRLHIPYERIAAVDGRSLADEREMEKVANMQRVREWPDLLVPNAIGCALSHYAAYRQVMEGPDDFALILEDDIKLSDELPGLLKKMEGKLDPGCVYLVYFHNADGISKSFVKQDAILLDGAHGLYKAKTVWGGYAAGGYIISKQLAARLAGFVFPVYTTADSWGVFYREKVIDGLWALLPLEASSANFVSDIGYRSSRIKSILKKLPFINSLKSRIQAGRKEQLHAYELVPGDTEWTR